MRLIKKKEKFYIACHTAVCGYYGEDTYVFPLMDEVEKFLGIKNDYEKEIYYNGIDINGRKRTSVVMKFLMQFIQEQIMRFIGGDF